MRPKAGLAKARFDMTRVDADFKNRVYKIVTEIPKGRVMTYGQIAAICQAAWAAWEVGQIAHLAPCAGLPACPAIADQPASLLTAHQAFFGSAAPSQYLDTALSTAHQKKPAALSARREVCPAHDLPWQRVVNKSGGLARGYPGGLNGHRTDLEAEGVQVFDDYKVEVDKLLWAPDQISLL
jgi:alkylated DNA nucleotide flippase Atl1